jgi:ABC-type transporter Mla subunit MlaD
MDTERLFELADELKTLRDHKQALEAELKQVNADIDNTDWHLSNLMADTETQNFTRAGTMFCLTSTTRASATPDRKDELFDALREEGFGSMVYETVNANSLSAFVKEQMAENGDAIPEWLDGLVKVFEKTTVGVRKAPK